jgi:hypothetical protein
MLRLALPALLTVIVCVFALPTVTLPKLTLVGATESCGLDEEVELVPVPVTGRVFIPPEVRLRAKVRVPEKLAAESGRKAS